MQSKLNDLSGMEFGSLVVVDRYGVNVTPNGTKQTTWKCKCSCGDIIVVRSGDLKRDDGKAIRACRQCANTKHGHTKPGWQSITYQAWRSMIGRCKRCSDYTNRGIKVCERWLDFRNFLKDVGERPSRKHTLDRIKNHLGYQPGNCRWATIDVQSRNKRSNVWVTIGGKRMILMDALRLTGVGIATYYSRIKRGMNQIDAITTPSCLSAPKSEEHRRRLSESSKRAMTKSQVLAANFLRRDGVSVAKIARRFGLNDNTVARACGASW